VWVRVDVFMFTCTGGGVGWDFMLSILISWGQTRAA
jgi:hypothetical protein